MEMTAEGGKSITICRRGKPVVDLVRTAKCAGETPRFGTLKNRVVIRDAAWWKPVTEAEVDGFLEERRQMRFLFDTVAFLWAVGSPERISRKAMSALRNARATREVSVTSLSEIAIKRARGKFVFYQQDVVRGIADLQLRVLLYTADHAYNLFDLPLHHADPFDRQIIAQALKENIPVITPDETFSLYTGLKILW